jgi:cytochrome c oxidase subunit 2
MPAVVRRRLLLVFALCALGLLLAGTAAAGNGGIGPVPPDSPNAERTRTAYWVIMVFTGIIFVIVEAALITFAIRFRRRGRPRTAEGPQIHGSTRLELIWTIAPVVILAIIGTFVFYLLPGIKNTPASAAPNEVRVEGHQFYWQFRYPNGAISINRLKAPVHTVVPLRVSAPDYDVIHSWWIPALGGKFDAIPGKVNHTWFKASKVGTYTGQCAELCGLQHAQMLAWVDVMEDTDYRAYVEEQKRRLEEASPELGKEIFEGVCLTCHRLEGERLIGPTLGGNPLLKDHNGLRTLVHDGRGKMPSVGKDWPDAEYEALFAYTKTLSPTGGTTGGG